MDDERFGAAAQVHHQADRVHAVAQPIGEPALAENLRAVRRKVHGEAGLDGSDAAKLLVGQEGSRTLDDGHEDLLEAHDHVFAGCVACGDHVVDAGHVDGGWFLGPHMEAACQCFAGQVGMLGRADRENCCLDVAAGDRLLQRCAGGVGAEVSGVFLCPRQVDVARGHQLDGKVIEAREDAAVGVVATADDGDPQSASIFVGQ